MILMLEKQTREICRISYHQKEVAGQLQKTQIFAVKIRFKTRIGFSFSISNC